MDYCLLFFFCCFYFDYTVLMFKLNKSIFQTQSNNSIYPKKKSVWSWWWALTKFYHITPPNLLMCTSCFIFLQNTSWALLCWDLTSTFLLYKRQWWTGHPTFLWKRHMTFLKSVLLLITLILNVNILTLYNDNMNILLLIKVSPNLSLNNSCSLTHQLFENNIDCSELLFWK